MDIELLRSFVAIVDTGSFTRAARQTFRTQSAISMQMKRLEEQVGCSLFRKDGRGMELTDDGKRLVHHARRLLSAHDEALASMRPESRGFRLRIGCPDDYVGQVLPALLGLIRTTLPRAQISIQCAASYRLRQLMDENELDLALVTRNPDSDEGYHLLQDKGLWAMSAAHFSTLRGRPPQPLPLALYEADCKFHSAALDGLDKQQRSYQLQMTSSSCAAILGYVRAQGAITAMASRSLPEDLVALPENFDLPSLPRVDLALVLSGRPHAELTPGILHDWVERFRELESKKGRLPVPVSGEAVP